MIPASWLRWGPMRFALMLLVISFTVAAFMLMRALQISSNERGELPVLPNPSSLVAPAPPPVVNVRNVVERDVFAVDRTGPTNAYLLPSEISQDTKSPFVPPKLQVLGIALGDGNSSFATCQVGTDHPVIVRVGDKAGPYTVKSIESKRVTFALPSGAIQTVAALTSGTGN